MMLSRRDEAERFESVPDMDLFVMPEDIQPAISEHQVPEEQQEPEPMPVDEAPLVSDLPQEDLQVLGTSPLIPFQRTWSCESGEPSGDVICLLRTCSSPFIIG
jgi:hypothetical protein